MINSTTFSKPSVIINSASGSTADISDDIVEIFESSHYQKPKVYYVGPEGLADCFQSVMRDGTDLLVVYGGDGTCNAGALIAREADIPLIALPGGTMNMLPKALYGTDDWKAALELALDQTQPRWQPAGRINHHIFFCGLIIGDPIIMSDAREHLRDGEVVEAVKQIPEIITSIAHGEEFAFSVDGRVFDTEANGLQIYCPGMTSGATQPESFELASAPQLSMSELVGIGARALTQDWRDSMLIKTAYGKRIEITGQGAFDALLDGEMKAVNCPVDIKLDPQGVQVLAPNLQKRAV